MTSHKVLIVEDDADSRLLLKISVLRALPDAEITFLDSVAGSKALGETFHGHFTLALLDGMLLDGTITEAWPYLQPFCESAKLLLVSALNQSELGLVAKTVPVTKIMQKPVSPPDIIAFITESFGAAS